MGRSVMTHPHAEVVAYTSWEQDHVSMCRYCDEEVVRDYEGWKLAYVNDGEERFCQAHALELMGDYSTPYANINDEAKHEGWDYDSDNFENDLEAVSEHMQELWPSLYPANRWPYDEVHVFLQNSLVEVSVSEYSGIVALCIAPRSGYDYGTDGLAKHWIEQVSERFLRTFGDYAKVGTFSNGESFYERSGGNEAD